MPKQSRHHHTRQIKAAIVLFGFVDCPDSAEATSLELVRCGTCQRTTIFDHTPYSTQCVVASGCELEMGAPLSRAWVELEQESGQSLSIYKAHFLVDYGYRQSIFFPDWV